MLKKIGDTGATHVASAVSSPLLRSYLQRMDAAEKEKIESYLKSHIAEQSKFSIGTLFCNPWPQELEKLYVFCGQNYEAAGYLLGSLVQQIVIDDGDEWLCTKTDVSNRDLETNFYWRAA